MLNCLYVNICFRMPILCSVRHQNRFYKITMRKIIKGSSIWNYYPNVRLLQDASVKYNHWNNLLSQNTEQIFAEITSLFAAQTYSKQPEKKASEIKTWILSTQEDKEVGVSSSVRNRLLWNTVNVYLKSTQNFSL